MPTDFWRLSGRTAWITGASRGIGLAMARLFTEAGARVVGIDLTLSDELMALAPPSRPLDVSHFLAVESACTELSDQGLTPDILVNNAGITRDGVLWKLSEADWDAVIDVNLKGAFHMMRHAVPLMRRRARETSQGGGSIVNIASINGFRGKFGQSNYCASKAGLIGLTKAAARELGRDKIRVNAVAPGMVETEMARQLPQELRQKALDESLLGQLAEPEDIAQAALYLASAAAKHVTGQVLVVDGGQWL